MIKKTDKKAMRLHRHVRVRGKISGTPCRPRLNVFRSNANIYAQIIDDVNGATLVSASTVEKEFEGATGNCEAAKKVGTVLAERAKAKGIEEVGSPGRSAVSFWHSPKARARAASNSKRRNEKWLITERPKRTMLPR